MRTATKVAAYHRVCKPPSYSTARTLSTLSLSNSQKHGSDDHHQRHRMPSPPGSFQPITASDKADAQITLELVKDENISITFPFGSIYISSQSLRRALYWPGQAIEWPVKGVLRLDDYMCSNIREITTSTKAHGTIEVFPGYFRSADCDVQSDAIIYSQRGVLISDLRIRKKTYGEGLKSWK